MVFLLKHTELRWLKVSDFPRCQKEAFLCLGWRLCPTILLSQTNKPALSITLQTCELFVPTAKPLQTHLLWSFKAGYIFSLASSKFPAPNVYFSFESGANKMMIIPHSGNLCLKVWMLKGTFHYYAPSTKHFGRTICWRQQQQTRWYLAFFHMTQASLMTEGSALKPAVTSSNKDRLSCLQEISQQDNNSRYCVTNLHGKIQLEGLDNSSRFTTPIRINV